jgi:hypothetical protein
VGRAEEGHGGGRAGELGGGGERQMAGEASAGEALAAKWKRRLWCGGCAVIVSRLTCDTVGVGARRESRQQAKQPQQCSKQRHKWSDGTRGTRELNVWLIPGSDAERRTCGVVEELRRAGPAGRGPSANKDTRGI